MGLNTLPPIPGVSWKRVVFLSSGTFTLPKNSYNMFDAILVAGGASGAKGTATGSRPRAGNSTASYFQNVYCLNETVLTITIGAGGATTTVGGTGNAGNATTITGITGSGVSSTISSGAPNGGTNTRAGYQAVGSPSAMLTMGSSGTYGGVSNPRGFGFGVVSSGGGAAYSATEGWDIFGTGTNIGYAGGTANVSFGLGGTGGPLPLLGSSLHSTTGSSGTAGTAAGGTGTANSFFAGNGGTGGISGSVGHAGRGGGGGGGGGSTVGGTTSGSGGAGSANSGGGGGGSGQNNNTGTNTGNGGAGGSGFVIIGYWG
jgi:hypothetical protein